VRAFTVRKAAKAHGTGQRIEGPFRAGDRVVVVEDVITTGGSALQAIEAVREAGAVVAGVLAVVDREEGGREAITGGAGVPVLALARAAEVLALLPPPPRTAGRRFVSRYRRSGSASGRSGSAAVGTSR
jgi:orotate phosphoribosyltransferase